MELNFNGNLAPNASLSKQAESSRNTNSNNLEIKNKQTSNPVPKEVPQLGGTNTQDKVDLKV